MLLLANVDKEDAHAREVANEIAQLLPESPERALRVLEMLRDMIATELPESVSRLLLSALSLTI
jgi:hypothetical protein